jgi:hypothetical protein
MRTLDEVVVLLDVDNTLFDHDRLVTDLGRHLAQKFGDECRDRYGTFSKRCARTSAMSTIWRPCNAIVTKPWMIRRRRVNKRRDKDEDICQ